MTPHSDTALRYLVTARSNRLLVVPAKQVRRTQGGSNPVVRAEILRGGPWHPSFAKAKTVSETLSFLHLAAI